jgi:putative membrane-bound dehydrogenase-like protein
MNRAPALLLLLVAGSAFGAQEPDELRSTKALEPADALRSFRIRPGYKIELVAAEPTVVDPVDLAFDEDGRLFVAEMIDYPYGDAEGNPPQGRIRLLEDRDGDGRYERSSVYVDRLRWPTAVAVWNGGVFVASVPDVVYFKDGDGDGVADRREVFLTGFGANNVQGLVNNLKWGLDNAFTGAASSSISKVCALKGPDPGFVDLRGRDFRFRPTGEMEPLSGGGLFGNAFDDFGRRFVCRNWYPAYHVVIEDRYVRRAPQLALPSAIQYIAPNPDPVHRISPPEAWRTLVTRQFLAGELPGAAVPTGRSTAYFTSATGTIVFRGTALAERDRGALFTAEAATNLVHRKALLPDGVTFRTERVDAGVEFLASTDNWFRPVNLANGPDGALYVCDMYRETIEHPAAIPEGVKKRLDLTSGKDRGRIWRVTREDAPKFRRPALGKASTAELVGALRRPDAWWRETAGRLLYQRQDRSAVPALEALASDGTLAASRAAALWALEGMGALRAEVLDRAFRDPVAELREQAVVLSERRPEALPALIARTEDSRVRVRFHAALALGGFADAGATEALARLAARDGGDAWMRTAILSSSGGRRIELLRRAGHPELTRALASMVGAGDDPAEISAAVALAGDHPTVLPGLTDGLRRGGRTLSSLPEGPSLLDEAERRAGDGKEPLDRRVEAVRILSSASFDRVERTLVPLIGPAHPEPLRSSAVRVLTGFRDSKVGALLTGAWGSLPAAVRPEALAWFRPAEAHGTLLAALEQGRLAPFDVGLEMRRALSANPEQRERARKLLGDAPSSDRKKVIAGYLSLLDRRGDRSRGREVYRKNCVTCHRADGEGREVGPDLTTVKQRSSEELLVAVLDPHREVNPQYLQYKVRTRAGDVLDGVIAAESASSVTLRRAEGEPVTLLRSDIEVMVTTNTSLMPEGLERGIDVAQMTDLFEFIRRIGDP